jgi:hypothetical protein
MSSEYEFFTDWRLKGTVQEVIDIMEDATQLPRWWPSVYLDAKRRKDGDANRVGEEITLYTKGFLPYTLSWEFRITKIEPQKSITLETWGDFVGRGIWTFYQEGEDVRVTYDWKIRAEKPLLRRLTIVMRPVFSANHHWAMTMGKQSLELELARRRAKSPDELAKIPAPPPPTPSSLIGWIGSVISGVFKREGR